MAAPTGDEPGHSSWPATVEEGLARIENALIRGYVEDLDRAHLVVCCGLRDGEPAYVGPFPSALDAVVAAEQEEQMLRAEGFDPVVSVAVLLPPPTDAI